MNRMQIAELNQPATFDYLQQWYHVEHYGQELLTDKARRMLRDTPALDRWLADFLVSLPGERPFLADSKFSFPESRNHSVEMRSLLAAQREDLPTWYIFSTWDGSGFSRFRALKASDVPLDWPCCLDCRRLFASSVSPKVVNIAVPDYCSSTQRTRRSSSTPFFVVRSELLTETRPTHMCRVCGGTVLSSSGDLQQHPACRRWPHTGVVYGPEWAVHTTAHGAPTDEPPAPAPFDTDMDAS